MVKKINRLLNILLVISHVFHSKRSEEKYETALTLEEPFDDMYVNKMLYQQSKQINLK